MYVTVSPTETVSPSQKISSPPSYSAVTAPLTSPPASSYPAVLVGRSANESKPKVPPPVPPRGTPKTKRGGTNGKGATANANVCSDQMHDDDPKLPVRHALNRLCKTLSDSDALKQFVFMSFFGKKQSRDLFFTSDESFDPDESGVKLKYFDRLSGN